MVEVPRARGRGRAGGGGRLRARRARARRAPARPARAGRQRGAAAPAARDARAVHGVAEGRRPAHRLHRCPGRAADGDPPVGRRGAAPRAGRGRRPPRRHRGAVRRRLRPRGAGADDVGAARGAGAAADRLDAGRPRVPRAEEHPVPHRRRPAAAVGAGDRRRGAARGARRHGGQRLRPHGPVAAAGVLVAEPLRGPPAVGARPVRRRPRRLAPSVTERRSGRTDLEPAAPAHGRDRPGRRERAPRPVRHRRGRRLRLRAVVGVGRLRHPGRDRARPAGRPDGGVGAGRLPQRAARGPRPARAGRAGERGDLGRARRPAARHRDPRAPGHRQRDC